MKFNLMLAGGALVAVMTASAVSQAATITGDFSAWSAAAGAYTTTSATGLADAATVTSFPLADGLVVSFAGSADSVYQTGYGAEDWATFSNGYVGDLVDSTTNTDTISFAAKVSAFGFQVSPDLGLFPASETITVTLSDGTNASFTGTYASGTPQFVGFTGGYGITSITIATATAGDFAVGGFVDVPEPVSMSILAVGMAGLAFVRRRAQG